MHSKVQLPDKTIDFLWIRTDTNWSDFEIMIKWMVCGRGPQTEMWVVRELSNLLNKEGLIAQKKRQASKEKRSRANPLDREFGSKSPRMRVPLLLCCWNHIRI